MKKISYIIVIIFLCLININVFAGEVDVDPKDAVYLCNQGTVDAFIFIGKIVSIAKILIPLVIIIMGMVDFGRAVLSNDEKAVNKCVSALIRRLVAGIVIFFVPSIVYATINIIQKDDMNNYKSKLACGKCVLRVSECNEDFIKKLPKVERQND